jgi:arsenate reductase
VAYEARHIVEQNPTAEELARWIGDSDQPVKKFFNTSGLKYKELGLKDKLPTMSDEEQIALLATDGMLVKRPLLIGDGVVLAGFKAEKWAEALQK